MEGTNLLGLPLKVKYGIAEHTDFLARSEFGVTERLFLQTKS
jgi:hypothetical protein